MRPSPRLSIVVDVVDTPTVVVVVVLVVVVNNPASSASSIKTVFPDPVGALHTNDVSVCVNINSNICLCISLNSLSFRAERVFNPRIFFVSKIRQKKKRPTNKRTRARDKKERTSKRKRKRKERRDTRRRKSGCRSFGVAHPNSNALRNGPPERRRPPVSAPPPRDMRDPAQKTSLVFVFSSKSFFCDERKETIFFIFSKNFSVFSKKKKREKNERKKKRHVKD